ncbi:hypothetical protein TNCT_488491 [Trichonephila clavata]|uniref:Uncharacterized protein n=1 Tax=Trichonephila clavata TaxID=2740835 RepID=A0A8X6GX56_TRICU|nr:hypothetical protein TNCT_488491 [Trichonephila clavata]
MEVPITFRHRVRMYGRTHPLRQTWRGGLLSSSNGSVTQTQASRLNSSQKNMMGSTSTHRRVDCLPRELIRQLFPRVPTTDSSNKVNIPRDIRNSRRARLSQKSDIVLDDHNNESVTSISPKQTLILVEVSVWIDRHRYRKPLATLAKIIITKTSAFQTAQ